MKRARNLILKSLLALVVIIPLTLVLLVRYTNGALSIGSLYFNYNETEQKFEFEKTFKFNGIDGPYLLGSYVFRVDSNNQLLKGRLYESSLVVEVNNSDRDRFTVELRPDHPAPPTAYNMPSKLIAISDIEGNFNGFSSFLQANQVIDQQFNWIYGDGHLVLVGDFVDRGENVIPTLWLIYKLEAEAEKSGGKVHFILGNHEIMNIQGNFHYAKDKYKKVALEVDILPKEHRTYKMLFSNYSHLGKWLRSKNTVEKIGDYLFVHAGLSPEIQSLGLSLEQMNQVVRNNIDLDLYKKPNDDPYASFMMGVKSPFWYRGLVTDYKYYDKISGDELDLVLDWYRSKKVVVGHTVVERVSKDFDGQVIRIDVKHGREKYQESTQGLFVEARKEYIVDARGNKVEF